MKIEGGAITDQLEEIRIRLGCARFPFVPALAPIEIDEKLPQGTEINALFDESGLLVYKGHPVFAYIRDHMSSHIYGDSSLNPVDLKKIHFTVCKTLKQKKKQGQIDRYRVINRDSNRYPIDIKEGSRTVEKQVQLYPCQYCLGNVGYQCFRYEMPKEEKLAIVREFDAREAFPLLQQQFSVFKAAMADAKSAMLSTDYPGNWRGPQGYSYEFRKSRKFICEGKKCGVDLSAYPRCLDAHHVSGNKPDCRNGNLRCLCKLCHQKEHNNFYPVSEEYRRIIEEERRKQGISP